MHIVSLTIDGLTKFVITRFEIDNSNVNASVLFNIAVAAEFSGDVLLFNTIPIYADNGKIQ